MPEMRHDPLQRRWVVISPERGSRPTDYLDFEEEVEEYDPFAEGNEGETPPEITAVRSKNSKPNGPGWQIRVFPNKYPAFKIEGDLDRRAEGVYDAMNGIGAHEMVIETPERRSDISLLNPEHAFNLGRTYRDRIIDLMKDRRMKYALLFRNHRKMAGASLSHPHSQIVATAVTPSSIAKELESARSYFLQKERCIFCDIINQERKERHRIVHESDKFIAFEPYASRFSFETWVMPKFHQHDFRNLSDDDMHGFMETLQITLQKLRVALNNPPYNLVLHTSPNTESFAPRPQYWGTLYHDWHWHIEILPRLGNVAGFEFGTGFFINSTPPEQAAEILRSAMI